MSGVKKYEKGHEFPNRKRLVKYVGSHPKFRTSLWVWECMDCGKQSGPSLTNSITRGKRPACCYQSPRGEKAGRWKGHMSITGSYLYQCQDGARKRGLVWEVTPEDLWELYNAQDRRCVYSGIHLDHGRNASLDRIDNTKGYTVDNIQWVDKNINRMKSDFGEEAFINFCHRVAMNTKPSWDRDK